MHTGVSTLAFNNAGKDLTVFLLLALWLKITAALAASVDLPSICVRDGVIPSVTHLFVIVLIF
jgi:hypothetical protein